MATSEGVSSSTLVPAASTPRVNAPTALSRPYSEPLPWRSSDASRPGVAAPSHQRSELRPRLAVERPYQELRWANQARSS
jgi:hypothetical protein